MKKKEANPHQVDAVVIYAPKDLILALQDGMYTLESMFVDKVKLQNKLTKFDRDVQKTLLKMQKAAVKYSYR